MSNAAIPQSAFAPAKINLNLRVTGRRADGYHLLDSIVAFTDLGDTVTVTPSDRLSLTIAGPFAGAVPSDDENLVLRAARLLAVEMGIEPRGALTLTKALPVESGIGGGSADAAAILRLLNRLWSPALPLKVLSPLALQLGADVPVCLAGAPCRMQGIGEILAPLPYLPQAGILLVNPGVSCPTPAVFGAHIGPYSDTGAAFDPGDTAESLSAALEGEPNDLTNAAISVCPAIQDVLKALDTVPGRLLARMSGSGATCFALFADDNGARHGADAIDRPGWWVAAGGLLR